MTFLESEAITVAADKACDLARDKFFEAFMPYSDAGLDNCPGHIYSPQEVELNGAYMLAMKEFYEALKKKYEAEAIWVAAMDTGTYTDPKLN